MLKRLIFSLFIINCLFSPLVFCQQDSAIVKGPFEISLYQNGKVYFEQSSDFEYPIKFVLEYEENGKKNLVSIDKYPHNGGVPKISSLFSYNLNNISYVFAIVVWDINHRGLGIFGQYYQIYGYRKNNKGILIREESFSKDNNLSGIDGVNDGEESIFKYKTAFEVKKYLDDTYKKNQSNSITP